MKLADFLKTKNLFVDGVTKEIDKAVSDRMWDVFDIYRDRDGLAQCLSALTGLFAYLGGAKNFARIVAAAIRDPAVEPTAKTNLIAALVRMQIAAETEKAAVDAEAGNQMTDAEIEHEIMHLTRQIKHRRDRGNSRVKWRQLADTAATTSAGASPSPSSSAAAAKASPDSPA